MAKTEKPYTIKKNAYGEDYTLSAIINGRYVSINAYKEKGERMTHFEKRLFNHLVEKYSK